MMRKNIRTRTTTIKKILRFSMTISKYSLDYLTILSEVLVWPIERVWRLLICLTSKMTIGRMPFGSFKPINLTIISNML